MSVDDRAAEDVLNGSVELSEFKDSEPGAVTDDGGCPNSEPGAVTDDGGHLEYQTPDKDVDLLKRKVDDNVTSVEPESQMVTSKTESSPANGEDCDVYVDDIVINKQAVERRFPNAVLPLLRYYQYESSESSSR